MEFQEMIHMKALDYKVPGGKLLRIKADISNDSINKVMIMGDFFIHPEEALENIENALVGCPLNYNEITNRIKKVIENNVTVVGFSAEDIANVLLRIAEL